MEIANTSADALRWALGVKMIALGWFALLLSAWLHGEITAGCLAEGAVTSGVYWTAGSFLELAGKQIRNELTSS